MTDYTDTAKEICRHLDNTSKSFDCTHDQEAALEAAKDIVVAAGISNIGATTAFHIYNMETTDQPDIVKAREEKV